MAVTRWASTLASPLAGASLSLGVGAAAQFLISGKDSHEIPRTRRAAFLPLVFCGAISALGVMALFAALSRTSVAIVASLTSTSPLVTLLIASVLLRKLEKITLSVALGAFLVVSGSLLVTLARPS